MKIRKTSITIRELTNDYTNESDIDLERGVYAYNGKLCVRPAFQRAFVYDTKQENAVIDTALKGFPLNIMYWVDNGDGTFDCLDGQQRTISLCNFVDGISSFKAPWINGGKAVFINTLKRTNPELYKQFMDYELEIYICSGTKSEQMEWFKVINIAGERLFPQELRNINYVSPWLTDAKRHFSKADSSSTAQCPAETLGQRYTNKNANRQEILAQVIAWRIGSDKDEDICGYMEEHMTDPNASDLWDYFVNVINWADTMFSEADVRGLDTVKWGWLYNRFGKEDFDANEIVDTLNELMEFKASKELDVSNAKIIEYCITRDENLLKHREFSEAQRTTLYNRQKGICPDCGEHFVKRDMHAHHIVSWRNGGLTELNNGVMLCKECHSRRHFR